MSIENCDVEMNGYKWEEIIRNYLSKLKVFQLKMRFEVTNKSKRELFNSFRTPFWLKKYQWFVRFHYSPNAECLYTLP
jgi:hypothetical protein